MAVLKPLLARLAFVSLALGLTAQIAVACPNWATQRTAFGQFNLSAGFLPDPIQVPRITAGGRHDLQGCFPGRGWTGFVITRPDVRLFYNGVSPTGRLSFQLSSGATDTIMLINAPDGLWYYNDDSNGTFNSTITFNNPMAGQYDIWAGAYRRSSNNAAQLWITER